MSDPIKLSDERVREILAWSVHPTGRGLVHLMPTDAEVAALSQSVLDLRTTVGMLEQACADRDKQIEDFISWLAAHDPSPGVREMAKEVLR